MGSVTNLLFFQWDDGPEGGLTSDALSDYKIDYIDCQGEGRCVKNSRIFKHISVGEATESTCLKGR